MGVTADGNDHYVIGVDYGTLSGSAVVVRVRDGKELGRGVFDYPHAVITESLPADLRTYRMEQPSGFRGNGRCRCRRTTGMCCVTRFRPRSAAPGSIRPPSSGLPLTSPRAPWCR